MPILVTGGAGFIGYHVVSALLARGETVLAIDDLNSYYDPELKRARLAQLQRHAAFQFMEGDIADAATFEQLPPVTRVVHLAAQAGVRYSASNPASYVRTNINGQMRLLEFCRRQVGFEHLVYASSSSVYGGTKDSAEKPISLYGATKRAGELLAESYHSLFGIPVTGLRLFTVYGAWGRPDMAYYLFTEALMAGKPITLYNHGQMQRDFTHISDVVPAILAALDQPASTHRLFNIGHSRPVTLGNFVAELERATGRKAPIHYAAAVAGDVITTHADIADARRELGFEPRMGLSDGLKDFVNWYQDYAMKVRV